MAAYDPYSDTAWYGELHGSVEPIDDLHATFRHETGEQVVLVSELSQKQIGYVVYYELFYEDDYEAGEASERGEETNGTCDDLDELRRVALKYDTLTGNCSDVKSATWFNSCHPACTRAHYEKGEDVYYSLHITNIDGRPPTSTERSEIARFLIASGKREISRYLLANH